MADQIISIAGNPCTKMMRLATRAFEEEHARVIRHRLRCRQCETDCRSFRVDSRMQECADACRKCAESCDRMAA